MVGHYTDQHYVSLERSPAAPPISPQHPVDSPPPPDSSSRQSPSSTTSASLTFCPAPPSSLQGSTAPRSPTPAPSLRSHSPVPRSSTPLGTSTTPTTVPSILAPSSPLSHTDSAGHFNIKCKVNNKTNINFLEAFDYPDDDSDIASVDSELFHQICDMDEMYGETYNVSDLSENVICYDTDDDSDDTVNSDLFQKVCEFDEVLSRQIEDFTTPPKRKCEEDGTSSSPSKSPRISQDSPSSP